MTDVYRRIVLDLDGTLVSTTKRQILKDSILLSFTDREGDPIHMWTRKRPGFDQFLELCFRHAVVGVWSMGQEGYVEEVVKLFPQRPDFVWSWWNCDRKGSRIYKDLNKVPDPSGSLMIDDSQKVIDIGDSNLLVISSWEGEDDDDQELILLAQRLFSV